VGPIQPQIRDSGGGFHVALLLKEPVVAGTAEAKRVDDLRTRLTAVLCGDAMPNHAAALLREVGTSNTKYGEPRLVQVIQAGELVDIMDVEDLLDLLGDAPLFTSVERTTNGHDHAAGEPRFSETKQPVDVEARLASMKFQGAGDNSVHITQLQVTHRYCAPAFQSRTLSPKCSRPPVALSPMTGLGIGTTRN
jgi:putative DNA primase/helicase